jgi:hypothetical protein
MFTFMDIMTVIGLFLLRFGVPLAVTALAIYFLKRLDARWEAEARAAQQPQPPAEQPAIAPAQPVPPARPRPPAPQPQTIFVPPPAKAPGARIPLHAGVAATKPCWEVKVCPEASKANCPATQHPDQACWQARFDAEGQIPEQCVSCETFQRYPIM